MTVAQSIILALVATPLLILARDAYNRRRPPQQLWLALGVAAAILINIVATVVLGPG